MNEPLPLAAPDDAVRVRAGRRATAPAHLIPLVFAVVAEAAWLTVVAGLVQEFSLLMPTLGIVAMAGFVVVGIVGAKVLAGRLGRGWPNAALGLCVGGAVVGWLVAPEARAALATDGLWPAITAHPGGWLAGLAVLRGFAHARVPLSEATLAHLLGFGIPTIVVAAIAGGMVAEPWRGRFLADALVAAIAFAVGGSLGLALVRLSEIGADGGFDWRRNPSWVALLVVLVGVTALLAIPISIEVAPLVVLVVGAAIGPILIVGVIIGFDLRTVRIIGIFLVAGVLIGSVLSLLGPEPLQGPNPVEGSPPPLGPPTATEDVTGWVVLLATIAIVAIVVLVRLWMRRPAVPDDDVLEQRSIDRSAVPASTRRRPKPRRGAPENAADAYVRLITDLADRPTFRREEAETPAAHARRLRREGHSDLSLDLLAADYALSRFAGVELSKGEDRRAVQRWLGLRRRLVEPRSH